MIIKRILVKSISSQIRSKPKQSITRSKPFYIPKQVFKNSLRSKFLNFSVNMSTATALVQHFQVTDRQLLIKMLPPRFNTQFNAKDEPMRWHITTVLISARYPLKMSYSFNTK